jgi:hypothetical protein
MLDYGLKLVSGPALRKREIHPVRLPGIVGTFFSAENVLIVL